MITQEQLSINQAQVWCQLNDTLINRFNTLFEMAYQLYDADMVAQGKNPSHVIREWWGYEGFFEKVIAVQSIVDGEVTMLWELDDEYEPQTFVFPLSIIWMSDDELGELIERKTAEREAIQAFKDKQARVERKAYLLEVQDQVVKELKDL